MILFIADRNWEQTRQELSHRGKTYHVRYKPRLENCPTCGTSPLSRYGWNESDYVDIPIGNQATILKAKVPRFLCAVCGHTVSPQPEGLSKRYRITEKCHEFILASRYKYPRTEIARMTGLHQSTIGRILADDNMTKSEGQLLDPSRAGASEGKEFRRYVPGDLAIDEVYLGRGRKFITLVDREESRLVDILETEGTRAADHAALDRFFKSADNVKHFPPTEYKGEIICEGDDIEITPERITMDMSYVYRGYFSCKKRFPGARIVLDRWHVEQALGKHFRKILAKNKRMRPDVYSPGTNVEFKELQLYQNSILYAKFANVNRDSAKGGDGSSPREKLGQLLLSSPHIIPAWEHRQRFHEIWSSRTRSEAENELRRWIDGIPSELVGYKKFARELAKWRNEYFNYFDDPPHARVTNAIAESTNNIIRRCYNRRKGVGKLEEFKKSVFADSIKNRPTASCWICGEVCHRDLSDTTDDPKYFNHKQAKFAGRPRKNWSAHAKPLLDVTCEECNDKYDANRYESWENVPVIGDGPIQESTAPDTSRDLDDFLDELRNDPRYRDWIRGGKKLGPVPPKNKMRRPEKRSDDGQQFVQFD